MSMTKKNVAPVVTLEKAQIASQSFAAASTEKSKLVSRMNEEIDKVKAKYQKDITAQNTALEEHTATLEAFANEQKKTWGKSKSLELLHTIIGFRSGRPKVQLPDSMKEDVVTRLVKKFFPDCVASKDVLDKGAILKFKDDEKKVQKLLNKCSISIVQEDTFYVQAKEEVAELV